MTDISIDRILARADEGEPVAKIAKVLKLKTGSVYAVLRVHRPKRKRTLRPKTSELRAKVRGLNRRGVIPSRIAEILGCSRAYVYKIQAESDFR